VRNSRIRRLAAIASIGGFLFGYDTGVISGALLYIKNDFHLSSFQQSAVVAVLVGGAAAGAMVGGRLADRLGRRRSLMAVAALFVVGIAGASLTPDLGGLVAARLLIGISVGAASVTVPLYISELAPAAERGALVSRNQLMLTVGIVVAYLVDVIFAPIHDWRAMFAVGVLPALALGFGALRLPETPRWLLAHGRETEARDVLRSVRSTDAVDSELAEISSVADRRVRLRSLLAPRVKPLVAIGVMLAVFQQVTGINTVIYYAPTILKSTGLGSVSSIVSTAGIGLVNVGMTIVAIRLIDKRGRRPLLLGGLVGMALSLAILGAAFAIGLNAATGAVAIVVLMLYVASFAIGLGPVFWLLISEIYPLSVRAEGMSIAGVANWTANFAVSVSFLLLVAGIGQAATFWLYGALTIATLAYAWKYVPETRHSSLEALEDRLARNGAADTKREQPLTGRRREPAMPV
jgi:sugar porter (SP) family MFS transporter